MSAKSELSSDSPEVVCTERYFEEEDAADEEATEELVEEKMPETDGISSQASLSSPEPLSVSPVIMESAPGANGVPLEMNLNFTATAIDGPHEWNGLVIESSVSDEFFDGTVNVETAEQCFGAPNSVPPNGARLGPQFVSRPHVHNHPVCPGGTLHYPTGPHSPHLHSPGTHSSGSSPYESGNSPAMHQYVVNVHVGPGETFSVRVGDEVQLIQGPATVRMVSNSGPPMPMPMQVPPGHMVQQIVDENGILTHVILSPQISSVTTPPMMLQASNDEGNGKWSDVVSYGTLPDQPGPPPKPQLKGRALSNSFKIYWDPPKDNGGTEVNSYILQLDDGSKQIHPTNEREFTAEQLQPGFTYRIRVQAVGPGGTGDWSEVLLVTTQAVNPGQCKPPRLHGRAKAIFLNLTWDCPSYDGGSPVTDYAVVVINPDGTTREVYAGHDTECGVAGLLPGRAYQFKVKAVNKAGAGPWSDSLEVMTGAGVPEAPVQPEIHCKSPHNAIVTWTEPNNNGAVVTEYRLEWQPKENLDFVPLYCGTALSHDLSRLSPATVYGFRVQAVNSAGVGPFSMVAECRTPSSSPGPVGSLRAIPTATSVQLSWKEPPSNGCRITSYNIDLGEKHLVSVENVTDYVIENLIPESTYKIRIQAVNSIGVGTFSSPIKVTTRALPPLAPSLECVSAGPKFLKLKWGDGKNADLIQYCLEMMRENGNFQAVYQGTAQTHKVTKLNELCHYHFRIFATNEAGDGPLSDTFVFATTRAPPGTLKPPKVSDVGMTSCIVEWSPLKPIGQDTFIYVLQLLATNDKDQQFHEVYRGAEQTHQLSSLQPRTNYQIRVCAIRICRDDSEGLIGPYSPSTLFTTSGSKPPPTVTSESVAVKTTTKLTSFQLSDSQWAILILLGFTLCAVILAFVAKQIIERTNNVVTARS